MGIGRLKKLIKERAPNAIQFVEWGRYSRIAVDISVLIHSYAGIENNHAISRSPDLYKHPPNHEQVTERVANTIIDLFRFKFLKNGITPIIVFDGKAAPLKEGELEQRQEERLTAKKQLDSCLDSMKTLDPWDRWDHFDELTKVYRRQRYYPKGIKPFLQKELTGLGITWYQATGEADELCAALMAEGVVDAVYSTDTDQLAYLTPYLITSLSGGSSKKNRSKDHDGKCEVILLEEVLKGLALNKAQFVDLCILLGTDYNTPLTNAAKKEGAKPRAINLNKLSQMIVDFGSIDHFPVTIDISCLNHLACRQQFSHKPSTSLIRN